MSVMLIEVRARTGQPPIATVIKQRRLKLFGHVARADLAVYHSILVNVQRLSTFLLTGDGQETALAKLGNGQSTMTSAI